MKVFQIRQNFKSGPILAPAGFVKRPQPEPNSSTALQITCRVAVVT